MSDLIERLDRAKAAALNGGVPMRRTDAALYSLLSECFAICREVDAAGNHDELREAVKAKHRSDGRNRSYVESKTDSYIMVCRYVLEGQDNRNSTYRYALALREAGRRGIDDLDAWLRENGGINSLYRGRPTGWRTATTRTLSLTSAVAVPEDEWFTLTLRRNAAGFFDVRQPR